jgi:hypothetical protein
MSLNQSILFLMQSQLSEDDVQLQYVLPTFQLSRLEETETGVGSETSELGTFDNSDAAQAMSESTSAKTLPTMSDKYLQLIGN